MSQNSFGAKDKLAVGDRDYEIFRLEALQERFDVARLPFSLKVLLENLLRTEGNGVGQRRGRRGARQLGREGAAAQRDRLHARARADAGLHRRAGGRRPRRDARRDGADGRRPDEDQPARAGRARDRPLRAGGRVRHARRLPRQRRARVRTKPRALRVPALGPGRVRSGSRSCRPTPASCTRSTSSTWRAWCSTTSAPARPTPTRSSAPTRTRRWSTASACSAGASAGSRPRRRCSASRCRCSSRRCSACACTAQLPEGATATDLVLTVTELLRKHGVVGKFVEFFGAGLAGLPIADRATIGNMSPEFGSDVRDLPDRRGDAALPALHRAPEPSGSRWSRPTPASRACGTTSAPSSRRSRTSSSSTSATCSRASPVPSARRTASRWRRARVLPRGARRLRALRRARRGVAESFPSSDPPANGSTASGCQTAAPATSRRPAARRRGGALGQRGQLQARDGSEVRSTTATS